MSARLDKFRQHCMYPAQYNAVIDLITTVSIDAGGDKWRAEEYAIESVHTAITNLMNSEPGVAYAAVGAALAVRVSMRLESNYYRQVVLAYQPV